MLTHRGFSAWIVANGEILPEYLVAVDEVAHRVSCWIPGEAGQVRYILTNLEQKPAVTALSYPDFRCLLAGSWEPGRYLRLHHARWYFGSRTILVR